MAEKPKASSHSQRELDKAEEQFKQFDEQVKDLTLDRMNEAPKMECDPQTKVSNRELQKQDGIYLKPKKSIGTPQKFNEKFREKYNYAKEYVPFIAEHKEIIGESIEIWTRPYGGLPAEYWEIPTGKKVYGPRYLAEQISRCNYHRLKMNEGIVTGNNSMGAMYGQLVVDTTIERLSARPVTEKKSIFMGASGF